MIGLFPSRAASAAALSLVLLAQRTLAQTLDQHSFGFKFAGSVRLSSHSDNARSLSPQTFTDIVQCETLHFAAIPTNTTSIYLGKAPYTVLTFEAGGISDRQDGLTNSSDIPWQVRHGPGPLVALR